MIDDLNEIVGMFGRGGHFHAAGFKINIARAPLIPKQLDEEETKSPHPFSRIFNFLNRWKTVYGN